MPSIFWIFRKSYFFLMISLALLLAAFIVRYKLIDAVRDPSGTAPLTTGYWRTHPVQGKRVWTSYGLHRS